MTVRVGVCGTAHWAGLVHLPGHRANADVELVGVHGRGAERRDALAAEFGIRGFERFEDMLDAVDAVSFVVPPAAQASLAIQAVRAGKHVLLEKPLAPDVPAARELVAAIDAAGVASLCFLTRMFIAEARAFLDGIRAAGPTTGKAVFHSQALLSGPYAGSAWRQEEHGALRDAAPHGMSMLVSALGPLVEVSASGSARDGYLMNYRHESGALSSQELNLSKAGVDLFERYEFETAEGIMAQPGFDYDRPSTFASASREFTNRIATGDRDAPEIRLALHLQDVIAAAEKSLATGTPGAVAS